MDNSRLIQLCSEGDKEAISILYRRYGPSMARVGPALYSGMWVTVRLPRIFCMMVFW